MKKTVLFLVALLLAAGGTGAAQEKSKKILIRGTVTDAEKKPVANAFIMVDGVKTSQVTNAEGEFRVKVDPEAKTLGIVSLGLGLKEQEIRGRTIVDFSFSKFGDAQSQDKEAQQGEQYVNMGYDYTKEKNNTYSVKKLSPDKKQKTYTTIYDMLREVPGVRIGGNGVIIHESRNLDGFVPALILLDGVPIESLDGISPTIVESIEVLKDAAASIYGTRAYGGVILIKTKLKNKK